MAWNVFILLFIFAFTGTVDSKYLGVPNAIKDFKLSSCSRFKYCAQVTWRSYEFDTVSFKVEFIPVHDGESLFAFANGSGSDGNPSSKNEFATHVKGLKMNETYLVHVFALNERGQSPPSPAVIFSLDPNWVPVMDRHSLPTAPYDYPFNADIKHGIEVEWKEVTHREDKTRIRSPIEYIFRYGDNKNTSLWKELKTNYTWIHLDDLENGREYSAYVVAREGNSTSMRSNTFPIMVGEDMTGFPEPVLTIEPADKNGVFAPGDSMTFKCSIPPNTYPLAEIALILGEHVERREFGYRLPITFNATASKKVDYALCLIYVGDRGSRRVYESWKVKETFDDENLQKKLDDADGTPTSFI